jgi:ubiquinol-cytochrome c reductase iron-sulfur subunit
MSEPEQERDGKAARGAGWAIGALVALRTLRGALRSGRALPPMPPEHPEDPTRRDIPSNRGAETAVALLLLGAAVFGFGFTAVYVLDGLDTQLLGIAIGGALLQLAVAAIVAGKAVVPQETSVQERDVLLEEPQLEAVLEIIESGRDGVTRRKLILGAAGVAGAGLLTAAATPLASLGPAMTGVHETPWRRGVRLVDETGRPYSASEIQIGSFYTALPEHGEPELLGSGLLVVKLAPIYMHLPAARRGWAPQDILAYSKICPHAGCAISLYRYPLYQPTSNGPAFTCPCHYSTFLPGEGGRVVFGPAGRSLPQLPLMIDDEGYLRAAGPFDEDIGPSWWGTRRSES